MRGRVGGHRDGGLLLLALLLGLPAGCHSFRRTTWVSPTIAAPRANTVHDAAASNRGLAFRVSTLALAEAEYSTAVARETQGAASCVDHYYHAATLAWPDVLNELESQDSAHRRATELYQSSVTKLLSTGQQFRRFDPRRGLAIQTPTGWTAVPTTYHGFAWKPEDFDCLVPVGDYRTKDLNRSYSWSGLGVATVAIHYRKPNEPFRKNRQLFAATAILQPSAAQASPFAIELYETQSISSVVTEGRNWPLRRDLTAPLVFGLKDENKDYLSAFLQPGTSSISDGLFMIEPYQSGKIPLVFVHGLLSDRFTWANMANEIRARPDLIDRYQLWGFEYATGEPFLRSAAVLRRQLRDVQRQMDPAGRDSALAQMVMIGHSMGGLIVKLQVTSSGDTLWQSVSNRPLESLATTPTARMRLAESFFFDPSPLISRVVYVGTPHRGSPWAQRPIGRLGASLVEEPATMTAQHQQLIQYNPGVFSREFVRRLPTSIDLLRTDSSLLQAVDRLPTPGRVHRHTILGSYRNMLGAGDSDGVVPVSSARHAGVVSERVVAAKHTAIHHDQDSIDEVVRILRLNLLEVDRNSAAASSWRPNAG